MTNYECAVTNPASDPDPPHPLHHILFDKRYATLIMY